MRKKGQREPVYFFSLNLQSKVKHPNQVLTHLVKGTEQIHITCDVWFVGIDFLGGTTPKG